MKWYWKAREVGNNFKEEVNTLLKSAIVKMVLVPLKYETDNKLLNKTKWMCDT